MWWRVGGRHYIIIALCRMFCSNHCWNRISLNGIVIRREKKWRVEAESRSWVLYSYTPAWKFRDLKRFSARRIMRNVPNLRRNWNFFLNSPNARGNRASGVVGVILRLHDFEISPTQRSCDSCEPASMVMNGAILRGWAFGFSPCLAGTCPNHFLHHQNYLVIT